MGLSTILLFTVFLIARSNYRDRFSSYWLIGWAFYTARSGFEVAGVLAPGLPGVTSGNLISLCGSAVFLLVAASSLGPSRRGGRVAAAAFFAASLGIAASEAIGLDKPTLILVVFLVCGAVQILTGIPFFLYRAKPRSFGAPLAALSLLLLGSLNLTYFWVRPDPLLAPLAYQLGTFLRTALGIAVAIVLFDSSREEARRSAFRYQALFNSLTHPANKQAISSKTMIVSWDENCRWSPAFGYSPRGTAKDSRSNERRRLYAFGDTGSFRDGAFGYMRCMESLPGRRGSRAEDGPKGPPARGATASKHRPREEGAAEDHRSLT